MEEQLFNTLVQVRRQLHQNPELGFTEFKTAALVEARLRELQIPVESVAGTGLIGSLKKGAGPRGGLRAGMDAPPGLEGSDVPFPSLPEGPMHACRPDPHLTKAPGAAYLFK